MYFDFDPEYCRLSLESETYNVIIYNLTRPSIEPTFYHTGGEQANNYPTTIPMYKCTFKYNMLNK